MNRDPTGVYCREHPDAPLFDDYSAGDQICSACGLVVGDRCVDVGSEWRTFSNENAKADPSRVGGPENSLLNGSDLSTKIGSGQGAAAVDEFGVAKYQNRTSVSNADRPLVNAYKEISQMADRMNLSNTITHRAEHLFKTIHDGKKLKGKSNDLIATACVHIACRQEGVSRTFKEICAVSKFSKKDIGRCFNLITKALDISVELITTGDFISRFCTNLGLPFATQKVATAIAKAAEDLDIVAGRSPISVAAATIFMASQASELKRSPKEIGDVAGVAEVTIRQLYKLIHPRTVQLFPTTDFKLQTRIGKPPSV